MPLTTSQLIEKIQQASGNGADTLARRDAFSELMRRYQDMAYGCALSLLGDPALAEDAAQSAFLTTYFTMHRINKPEAFAAFLRRIVSRQCSRMIKEQRHYKTATEDAFEMKDTADNPYEAAAGSEENRLVRNALTRLPADLRMTTVLYYMTGYSVGEIAACMELPPSTVKKRLHDARTRLRDLLEQVFESAMHRYKLSRSDTFVDKFLFFRAISNNDQEQVAQYLDSQPALIDSRGTWQWTPLIRAAENGHTDLVERLIARGAHIAARETLKNGTALHRAAGRGHTETVACLLRHGAAVNDRQDCHRQGPLGWAVLQGELAAETAALLIGHGAETDIFTAVALNRTDDAAQLISRAPESVHHRLSIYDEDERQTPLHLAIRHDRLDMISLLIDHGADIHSLTDAGTSSLCMAVIMGNGAACNLLEQAGVIPDLSALLAMGDEKGASRIIEEDPACLEEEGPYGALIHVLARAGRTDAVRFLLDAGVSPNRPWGRQYDHTPLYMAAWQHRIDTVRVLVDYGADVNVQDALWGGTPLHYAAFQGDLDMAVLLVEAGAEVNPIEHAHLNTPLAWAQNKKHTPIVAYLTQHGGTTQAEEFYVMPE